MTPPPMVAERFRPYLHAATTVAAVVATAALLGRLAGWLFPAQVFSSYPALKFNSAIGILAAAAAIRGLISGRMRTAIAGAACATLIGAVTLVEYLTGLDVGIDRVFVDAANAATSVFPGRMSIATALGLVMVGTGVLELTVRRPRIGARQITGLLGTITVTLAVTVLFSYATDVLSTLRFGYVSSLSIPGAVCLALLGASLVMIAWHQPSTLAVFPSWLPIGAGASVLVAAMLMSGGLAITERERAIAQIRERAVTVHYQITDQLDAALRPLRQLGEHTGELSPSLSTDWTNSANNAVENTPGLVAVEWVGDDFLPIVQPVSSQWGAFDQVELARLFAAWPPRDRRDPSAKFLAATEQSILVIAAVPSCAGDSCRGFTLALINPAKLLAPIIDNAVAGYGFEIAAPLRPVYVTPGVRANPEWTAYSDTVADGLHWKVKAWPGPRAMTMLISDLPAVVAGLGFVVSALLAATLQLVQNSVTAARRSERERIATAIEGNTEGIWETDLTTGREFRSPGLWRQLGYDAADAHHDDMPRRWLSLIHPDDRPGVERAIADHVAGTTDAIEAEYRIEGRDGWHWIIDRGRAVERDEQLRPSRLLGTSSDVTERKRAEELLATSERRFRAVFNSGFQFETLLDLDCTLIEANRTSLEFAGVELDEVKGRKFWDTPWWSHSDAARERLERACVEANRGQTVQYQDEVQGLHDRRALIDFSLKPILDADGNVVQLLAEGRDITERKRAEDSVREMDTLGTIGRLAARVAHEINNPLAGIQNSFLLIKDAVPETHPYFSYVGAIEREIARIAAVTRQLYETFRPEADGTADSAVAVVISDAVNMLKQVNRATNVQIDVDTSRAPPILAIPSPLLRQAVYNLVQNAVEASPPGGTVSVTAWRDRDVFWLAVRDQGPGVQPEMREKIFEPFVTTKGSIATGGMGLGLSLVRRALQAMGGRIEVNDAPGGGAEFRIRLPIT